MSHLAVAIRDYCDQPGRTAKEIETRAGVPNATIAHILRDSHPRPERFALLLKAVDDTTARRWLTAYLRDDCPEDFLSRLEIIIRAAENQSDSTVAESATSYAEPEFGHRAVNAAFERLKSAIIKDADLGRWFINTINLILGPA